MAKSNPLYEDVPGAPVKIGQVVKIIRQSDETGYPELVGQNGIVHHLEYECGCGQVYPESPMIGVKFDGDEEPKEFWIEELRILQTITFYHVFTHSMDDSFLSKKKAIELYEKWKEDYHDVRLYREVYKSQDSFQEGNYYSEDCLMSNGNYPH